MKKLFLAAAALFVLFVQAKNPAYPKTIYLSKTFVSHDQAQKVLSKQAFFLFDIHSVLFIRGNYLQALKKMKSKQIIAKQAVKSLFSKKARAEFRKLQKSGNKITERKFDIIKNQKQLYNELIDFSNHIYRPDTQMHRLLLELKHKGHELYLLSNIGNVTLDRLSKMYPDFFSVMTDARNTINRNATTTRKFVCKPHPEAYTQAVATVGKSEEAYCGIFVDDKLENVRAAQKAGLNAIHFTSYQQFFHDVHLLLQKQ